MMLFFKFINNRSGAYSVVSAVIFATLLTICAFVLGVAQTVLERNKAQSSADLAVLSARIVYRDAVSQGDVDVDAVQKASLAMYRFFQDNQDAAYDPNNKPTFENLSSNEFKVALTSKTKLPFYSAISPSGNMQYSVESRALDAVGSTGTSASNVEIAIVFDNTASLCYPNCGWLDSLIDASKGFTNTLFGPNETVPGLSISVVPFVMSVNIGPQRANWLINGTNTIPTMVANGLYDGHPNRNSNPWLGCVEARAATPSASSPGLTMDITDELPSAGGFDPHYDAGDNIDNAWNGQVPVPKWTHPTAVTEDYRSYPTTRAIRLIGPNKSCPKPIQTFLKSKTLVNAEFENMRGVHGGGTALANGTVWGWRTLSPKWQGLWDASEPSLPSNYNDAYKAIVILSDGNNQYFPPNGWNGSDSPSVFPGGSQYGAYGRLSTNSTGVTYNKLAAENELDRRFHLVCDMVKAEGIEIFTVLARYPSSSHEASVLRRCSSGPNYHYATNNAADIGTYLQEIAGKVKGKFGTTSEKVRLTR